MVFINVNLIVSVIGWSATIIYLVAYLLLSVRKISADKPFYHILNALGGIGLTINGLALDDYPNVVVNGAWFLIAFVAIGNILNFKKKNSK